MEDKDIIEIKTMKELQEVIKSLDGLHSLSLIAVKTLKKPKTMWFVKTHVEDKSSYNAIQVKAGIILRRLLNNEQTISPMEIYKPVVHIEHPLSITTII